MSQSGLLELFTKAAPDAILFSLSVASEKSSIRLLIEKVESERRDDKMRPSMVPSGVVRALL